jgi:hypothetical protein
MKIFMFYMSRPTFFHCLFFNLRVSESTLWFQWTASNHCIIIIANPILKYLVSWATLSRGIVAIVAAQAKDGHYRD